MNIITFQCYYKTVPTGTGPDVEVVEKTILDIRWVEGMEGELVEEDLVVAPLTTEEEVVGMVMEEEVPMAVPVDEEEPLDGTLTVEEELDGVLECDHDL